MPAFSVDTPIADVVQDPSFAGYGHLLFPMSNRFMSGYTLGELRLKLYTHINPNKTVEIVNYLKEQVISGNRIFYDIYTEQEKVSDPNKRNTGLFFFQGHPYEKFAICNAGGGFLYVGAMHDSFPHALELSKNGYNAFALIYRSGRRAAFEDLARAISLIHEHAASLQIDPRNYSLWGGSAGARMAAVLGTYGTKEFCDMECPRPSAVIMQYNGMEEVIGNEPPTYCCVGDNDNIVPYSSMKNRVEMIKMNGTNAEIEIFENMPHGFGLGEGTVAEGWIDRAIAFWEITT